MPVSTPRLPFRAIVATVVLLASVAAAGAQAASIVGKPTTSARSYYVLRSAKGHCRAHFAKRRVTIRVHHGKHVVKRTQYRCVSQTASGTSAASSTTPPATFPADLPTATVTVTVIPSAANHTYATQANVPLSVGAPGVLQGATGTGLSAVLVSGPAHGTLTLHRDGSFSYTPEIGASGIEQFVYRASSSDGESSTTASVTLRVTPVAAGGLYDVDANGTLQIPAGGLLANDVGSGLSARLVGSTIDGSVSVSPDGGATYTPDNGFSGADSFTYDVVDASGQTSNTATVTINVGAQPPSVVNETFGGAVGNTELQVGGAEAATPEVYITGTSALAGDGDPNGGSLSTIPGQIATAQGGSVTMGSEGNFTYEPPAGFSGPSDTFSYTVAESEGYTATATATIDFAGGSVWYVNDAAGAGGNGTSVAPFDSVGQVTQAAAGDTIFLFAGSGDYTGGITLPPGVSLVGAGATLSADGETLLAQSGPTPVLTNSGGAGVTVGEGDSIAGVAIANTSGDGIAASGVNGFTVAPSVTVSDAHGDGLDVTGGDGTIDFAGTITSASGDGHSVAIQQRGASSAVHMSGPITDDGSGILLEDDAGTTSFTSSFDVDTTTAAAFVATDAGAITADAGDNTLQTTTGVALSISGGTTIGADNLDFASISAGTSGGGPSDGIDIAGAGGSSQGTLNVDGGTIEKATSAGVSITDLPSIDLQAMTVESTTGEGIAIADPQQLVLNTDTVTGSSQDAILVTTDGSTDPQFNIENNILYDQAGTAIALDLAGGGNGFVTSNLIGTSTTSHGVTTPVAASGSTEGDGIDITDSADVLKAQLDGNTIEGIESGSALNVQQQGDADVELTIEGPDQTFDIDGTSTDNAMEIDSASDTGILCLDAMDNSLADPHSGTNAISVDQEQPDSDFEINGYSGSTDAEAESYLGTGLGNSGGTMLATGTFVGGTCQVPTTVSG